MGSAELSGGIDEGFGALASQGRTASQSTAAKPTKSRLASFSPASLAIAATALLATFAFITYDAYRTVTEMEERAKLVAALAAAEIAPRDLDAPRATRFALPPALAGLGHYVLTASDGEVLASTAPQALAGSRFDDTVFAAGFISARAAIAGGLGHVTIAVPHTGLAPMLVQRWSILLGGTLLLAMAVIRRRRETMPPALPRTEERMQAAVEAMPHGLARWNGEGTLVCANAAFARLLRIEEPGLGTGTSYETVSQRIRGRISARPVLDEARRRIIEVQREDGSTVMLDERPCADGGFITLVSDITDRKMADMMLAETREAQRELARQYHEEKIRAEAASRAKTAFLAHLSHDIRTPLNHIIGFAEMIGMEACGPLGNEKYRAYVGNIKQAGEKLLGSFAEILDYAELEGGRKELQCERVPVRDLLEGVAARFTSRASRAGIRLHVAELAPGVLHADRHCLNRMLGNLIDNAIRFTPRGGEIRLAAWAAEDGVVLEVSDNGAGMGEEQLSRLSQPFVLSDAAFTRTHEGVGLGIAIARAIAELTGGRLVVDSMADVGTTVAISLPLCVEAHDAAREARAA